MPTTLTIVEASSLWAVIAATDDRSGLVDYRTSYQSAYDLAYATLIDAQAPPVGPGITPRFIQTFTHTTSPYRPRLQTINLSDIAWQHLQRQTSLNGYEGRGRHHGVTHYLAALLQANPDPTRHWTDTRPPELTTHDAPRLLLKRFPIWGASPTYYCPPNTHNPTKPTHRNLNYTVYHDKCEPALLQLSNHFLITPLTAQATPHSRAASTLEAIGYQYLTPKYPPLYNPNPVNAETTQKYYYTRKRAHAVDLPF
jgi:hypothetical protein